MDVCELRHVILPKNMVRMLPKKRLMHEVGDQSVGFRFNGYFTAEVMNAMKNVSL